MRTTDRYDAPRWAKSANVGLAHFDHLPTNVPKDAQAGGMIHGLRIGDGETEALSWPPPVEHREANWLWLHLDRTAPETEAFLREGLALPEQVVEGLLDVDTRPRLTRAPGGLLMILRGVNHNPGEAPDQMVALRLWIAPSLVVTLRRSPLLSVHELREAYARGGGPRTVDAFLADLIEHISDRVADVVADLVREMDQLEDIVIAAQEDASTRERLGNLRRRVARLARYLAPQRDALRALLRVPDLFADATALDLTESVEQTQQVVEELEAARERAIILSDELRNRADARVARHSYMLSVAAGVFLPITFLTGLLGINVGGIPGADEPNAFWMVVGLCIVIAIALWGIFLTRRWL